MRTLTFFPEDFFQGLPKLQTLEKSQGFSRPALHDALEPQVYRDAQIDALFPIQGLSFLPGH